jgi:biopolymer transport protein ExbB
MKPMLELIEKGGPTMFAIMALAVVLYARCFRLLLGLRRSRRLVRRAENEPAGRLAAGRRTQETLQEWFRHQRIALGAMIAAAPLLGLLGTVSGMAKTFNGLSATVGERSMEGLARGISEVLVATESGLLVALPALALVYVAHREVQRLVAHMNGFDPAVGRGSR